MKFEKVSLKKTWKAPVLRVLTQDDDLVRIASAIEPRFAAAMKSQPVKA